MNDSIIVNKEGNHFYMANGEMKHDLDLVREAILTYTKGENTITQPPVFLKDDALVQLYENRYNHTFSLKEVKEGNLRIILSTAGEWYKITGNGKQYAEISKDLIDSVLDGPWDFDYFRNLAGICNGVGLDSDWNVVHTKGYNEKLQIYFTKTYDIEPVPENPTDEDIQKVKDMFWDIYREFKFKDKNGRESIDFQNTILALITIIIRPMWGDFALPDIAVIKSSVRCGGSLNQEATYALATGERIMKASSRNDMSRDHYEAMIESALLSGNRSLFLDNCDDEKRYSNPRLLQHSVGNGHVLIRKFGTQQLIDCPPKTTVLVNGVNLLITADDTGRVIPIYIVPDVAWQNLKYERDENDLINLCIEKHPEAVRGVAMFYRYWKNKGCPMKTSVTGNFKAYPKLMKTVLPMLYTVGYKHVLENLEKVQGSDNIKEDETFGIIMALKDWSDKFYESNKGKTDFTPGDLAATILDEVGLRKRDNAPGLILPHLPESVHDSAMNGKCSLYSTLGLYLSNVLKGKKAYGCGYYLVQVEGVKDRNGSKHYKIEEILKQENVSDTFYVPTGEHGWFS